MIVDLKRLTVVLITAMTLSACGYHLRGRLPLSQALSTIALDTTNKELRQHLTEALALSGATVVADQTAAGAIMKLFGDNYTRQVVTLDDRGRATSYTLIFETSFNIANAAGEPLRKDSRVRVERHFAFDANELLQAEDEERDLREDMLRDLVQQIMRQLSTIASVTDSRVKLYS